MAIITHIQSEPAIAGLPLPGARTCTGVSSPWTLPGARNHTGAAPAPADRTRRRTLICGQVGKQDNCQVAVGLSLATAAASLPIAWRLYLAHRWCDDATRRAAGVPATLRFATKPQLALQQIWAAKTARVPIGIVLADAAYGSECAYQEALAAMGLHYAVGIGPGTSVWTPGTAPLPPQSYGGHGKRATLLRRAPGRAPRSVKAVALGLSAAAWHQVAWREGSNRMLSSCFAWLRVRPAHRNYWRSARRAEE